LPLQALIQAGARLCKPEKRFHALLDLADVERSRRFADEIDLQGIGRPNDPDLESCHLYLAIQSRTSDHQLARSAGDAFRVGGAMHECERGEPAAHRRSLARTVVAGRSRRFFRIARFDIGRIALARYSAAAVTRDTSSASGDPCA
jgi:hypothetical protein